MDNTTRTVTARVADLADQTADAYSYDRYGANGWRGCIRILIRHGLTDPEIVAVLRSKWTRWAGDRTGRYGDITGKDLERFMDTARGCHWQDVAALTKEHEEE